MTHACQKHCRWSRHNKAPNRFELHLPMDRWQQHEDEWFKVGAATIWVEWTTKDIGARMSNDGSFTAYVNKITQSARDMCLWISHTFKSRSPEVMLTLWKTLVLPILVYCSQLCCPITPMQICLMLFRVWQGRYISYQKSTTRKGSRHSDCIPFSEDERDIESSIPGRSWKS